VVTSAKRLTLSSCWLAYVVLCIASCNDREGISRIPQQFARLTVYDVEGFTENLESIALVQIPHATLEETTVQAMFRDIRYRRGTLLWKGSSLGVAKMQDGSERHLAISYYGGFFKILDQKGYYEVVGESRKLFDEQMNGIIADTFIPARHEAGGRQYKERAQNNEKCVDQTNVQ